jgi:hypothetical protein
MEQLVEEMKKAEAEKSKAVEHCKTLRLLLQTTCEHLDIVEGPWQKNYFSSDPEFRVCRTCGLSENGWGCGFQVLHGRSPQKVEKADTRPRAAYLQRGPRYNNHQFVLNVTMREEGITQTQLNESVIKEGLGVA